MFLIIIVDFAETTCYDSIVTDSHSLMKGGQSMTDTNLLKEKVIDSGYRLDFICKTLGITKQAWLNKVSNKSEFKQSEIVKITELLGLKQKEVKAIFFTLEGD